MPHFFGHLDLSKIKQLSNETHAHIALMKIRLQWWRAIYAYNVYMYMSTMFETLVTVYNGTAFFIAYFLLFILPLNILI